MRATDRRGRRAAGAALCVTAFAAGIALLVAGCSGSSNNAAVTAKSDSPSSAGSSATAAPADFQEYLSCLAQHGVTVPSLAPGAFGGGRPRPSGSFARPTGRFSRPAGGFSRPPGGFGSRSPGSFGGFLGTATADPTVQAALQACASVRPRTGFGRGAGNRGQTSISATTFASFKSCMSGNGVTITQSDPQAALRALDRGDPTTAAALRVCQPILGSAGATATATTSPAPPHTKN